MDSIFDRRSREIIRCKTWEYLITYRLYIFHHISNILQLLTIKINSSSIYTRHFPRIRSDFSNETLKARMSKMISLYDNISQYQNSSFFQNSIGFNQKLLSWIVVSRSFYTKHQRKKITRIIKFASILFLKINMYTKRFSLLLSKINMWSRNIYSIQYFWMKFLIESKCFGTITTSDI